MLNYQQKINYLIDNRKISASNDECLLTLQNPESSWIDNLPTVEAEGFQKNQIWYHSRRDPKREAKRQMDHICNDKTRHLVFLSAGIGYPLISAFEEFNMETALIIEADKEVLFYLISLLPDNFLQKDIFFYYCPKPYEDTLENILSFFQSKNINQIQFYKHLPAFQAIKQDFLVLEEQVSDFLYKRSVNQATIVKFQGIWNKNIALNVRELCKGSTLNSLIDKLKGKAKNILICGAGPSLEENYEDLIKYRNYFLLISADTAFLPLTKNGIVPDIVISADPQWVNHYFVLSPDASKSIWLLDPVVCYQSSHFLKRKNCHIYWWDNPFYLDELIRDSKNRGEIAHGGSVSTNAYDLALKLESQNIILVGQDLSFSNQLAHVKGSAIEAGIYNKNDRFHGFEMHNFRQMRAIPPRAINNPIRKNDKVFTNDKLLVFKRWFESQGLKICKSDKPKLFNATKSGAVLENFRHDSLDNILINFNDSFEIPEIYYSSFLESRNNLIIRLEDLKKDCKITERLYRENFENSLKLQKKINVNQVSAQMTLNDEKIKKFSVLNQILSINAQKIIISVTEMDNEKNMSIVFYKLMYYSARKLNYTLSKMIHILKLSE